MFQGYQTVEEVINNFNPKAETVETATFGMGCFWGPESMFGSIPGVLRTRVGFAGGTSPKPTYRHMGDHTEAVEIDFDPAVILYEELLRTFWQNHYPNRGNYKGRQYISLIRYRGQEQRAAINKVKKEMEKGLGEAIETDIAAFEDFTLADARHQKYYLKRYPHTLEQLQDLLPKPEHLVDSTFAARLNGFVKGYGKLRLLKDEIAAWDIAEENKEILLTKLASIKW
ncbi:peptide-methionine (S)-S-oxide reductase MsrA [Planococcus beigongshangi]|uniref:peptide-methionine (S)-S-oxide reductase MsrA n=1 Tax=Planococcus beigongshangi TaxID=2782536 RepID=UPI00193BCF50|nr:peptide-methionine (S)-S-oxide reductase MsrA [Planococcus beigongshangi]